MLEAAIGPVGDVAVPAFEGEERRSGDCSTERSALETDMAALREAVGGVVAKYRLDPVGDNGKVIEDAPAAYVQVVRIDEPAETAPQMPNDRYAVVKEAMRLNTELAKAMVERFPEM